MEIFTLRVSLSSDPFAKAMQDRLNAQLEQVGLTSSAMLRSLKEMPLARRQALLAQPRLPPPLLARVQACGIPLGRPSRLALLAALKRLAPKDAANSELYVEVVHMTQLLQSIVSGEHEPCS